MTRPSACAAEGCWADREAGGELCPAHAGRLDPLGCSGGGRAGDVECDDVDRLYVDHETIGG